MLKAMFKKIGKSKKGFTLIELLVVIAILAVLAAILVPTVSGFITSAKQQSANSDAHTVYTAAVAYVAAHSDTITLDSTKTDPFDVTSTVAGASNVNLTPYLGPNSNLSNIVIYEKNGAICGAKCTGSNGNGTYGSTT